MIGVSMEVCSLGICNERTEEGALFATLARVRRNFTQKVTFKLGSSSIKRWYFQANKTVYAKA